MKANCWEKHQGSFTSYVTVFSEVRDSVQGELAIRVFKNNKVSRVVKFLSKFNNLCSRQADLKAVSPKLGGQFLYGAAD